MYSPPRILLILTRMLKKEEITVPFTPLTHRKCNEFQKTISVSFFSGPLATQKVESSSQENLTSSET